MKFSKIEKLPTTLYAIDVYWPTLNEQIAFLGNSNGVNLIPPYQRGYVWTHGQKVRYIEYILKGGLSGRDIYWNAKNWVRGGEVGILELVDGLQRITAVQGFLDNKFAIFGQYYYKDFTDKPKRNVSFRFHVNDFDTQLEVVDWYFGLNNGGTYHTPEHFKSAYDYKQKLLQKK